ncbi:MAG: hypothetical protein ACR2PY_04335 [Salinispira sp.]
MSCNGTRKNPAENISQIITEGSPENNRQDADILLIPPDPIRQRDSILRAVLERRFPREYLDRAARRIIAAKIQFNIWQGRPTMSEADVYAILGSTEHRAMLEEALAPSGID